MGDLSAKKRKMDHLETEDPVPQRRRQKTRVVEDTATDTEIHNITAKKNATKDGKSRQEKSERRSSKKQKKRSADTSVSEETGGDNLHPTSRPAHKKHRKARVEKPDANEAISHLGGDSFELSSRDSITAIVESKPTTKVNHSSEVPDSTNGRSLCVAQDTDEMRPKKKSRTKVATTQGVEDETTLQDSTTATESQNNSKAQRFILFIGNLPYSATTPQIASHFSKLTPTSIRHSTDKSTGRSKGFAFLEFAGYDKMKTCLKLYHHSVFDPEESRNDHDSKRKYVKKPGRRINVELTVGGGGGHSEKRKEKIKGKNLKLEEERERRRVKELQDAESETKKSKNPATDANATLQTEKGNDMGDIHPTRRARVG